MNIVVAFKVVPDDQDIQVAGDRSLDFSKAKGIVSAYDLNAIEAAAQLAAAHPGSTVTAITVGPASIDDSKLKKNVLARGVDNLRMVADDALADLDAAATAEALAALLGGTDFDVVLCGDGSADDYAQQVDVQLAARLGLPSVSAVTALTAEGDTIVAERTLEDVVEEVRVPLPAVVAVSPDVALPRIPGMKDILAAGKKPMEVTAASVAPARTIEVVSCAAPQAAERACTVLDASADGAVEEFAAALKAAL
ncbi:electron transfer flavoprotein [Adlercreutzia sp. R7]|uniref:Electron transfer flavoprotein small subunit n=1 Tax=Adlercreutzia wanghongyangiae TaxID=3111451 RepID=A0ABU6IKK9_9ACTN|nr:electron transfer flavoprotein [Adlercreutzia sp. R7]